MNQRQKALIKALIAGIVAFGLLPAAFAQTLITFQYFYDETGQLTRVVDSTGVVIEYVYDAVGNILQVNRSTLTNPGGLSIFSFSPQQGGPLSTVTIQGQGFSTTAVNNVVRFNGIAATVLSATATTFGGSGSSRYCDRAYLGHSEWQHGGVQHQLHGCPTTCDHFDLP